MEETAISGQISTTSPGFPSPPYGSYQMSPNPIPLLQPIALYVRRAYSRSTFTQPLMLQQHLAVKACHANPVYHYCAIYHFPPAHAPPIVCARSSANGKCPVGALRVSRERRFAAPVHQCISVPPLQIGEILQSTFGTKHHTMHI